MNKRLPGHKKKRLEAIAYHSRGLKIEEKLPFGRSELIKLYFADVAAEDLEDREPRALAAAAINHVTWAASRKRGVTKVRAFNPNQERDGWTSEHTIVELVNDDMPFLVDSVTMALDRLGHGIVVTIHPLLRVTRTPTGRLKKLTVAKSNGQDFVESYIHIEIRRETDRGVLSAIESAVRETLRDVRSAVNDWPLMVDRLRDASEELHGHAPTARRLLEQSCEFLDWLANDNFTLLGYHEFRLIGTKDADRLRPISGTGLGILRDAEAFRSCRRPSRRSDRGSRCDAPWKMSSIS